ncbi:hypothetical protein PGTUg99_003324 [Puccinia graminis f. sp. tritici]|uniref:Uncharacterized protein n=1 Tax=Puccinia graminis f. sp. tritici TaxID=56615 RepID=A0A5B0LIN8_PUCGR|nr:hypothetical protein PGTUg99_003324 [Puccinia graminis f. sp. tritici]
MPSPHRHPNGKIQPMPDPRMATRLRLRRTRQTPVSKSQNELCNHIGTVSVTQSQPVGWSPQCGKGDERRAADLVVGRTDQSELRTTCHTSPDHDTSGQTSLHVLLADTELINQDPATD